MNFIIFYVMIISNRLLKPYINRRCNMMKLQDLHLTLSTLGKNFSRRYLIFFFSENGRQLAWNVKNLFSVLEKIRKQYFKMSSAEILTILKIRKQYFKMSSAEILTILVKISADDILKYCFLIFSRTENRFLTLISVKQTGKKGIRNGLISKRENICQCTWQDSKIL